MTESDRHGGSGDAMAFAKDSRQASTAGRLDRRRSASNLETGENTNAIVRDGSEALPTSQEAASGAPPSMTAPAEERSSQVVEERRRITTPNPVTRSLLSPEIMELQRAGSPRARSTTTPTGSVGAMLRRGSGGAPEFGPPAQGHLTSLLPCATSSTDGSRAGASTWLYLSIAARATPG